MIFTQARGSRAHRRNLLLSAAGICLVTASAAQAQDVAGPIDPSAVVREAQGGANGVGLAPGGAEIVPQIVIANPNTTVSDRDPVNITGVGQMVTDIGGGFIGLCTATLINPRTVIFAAHCVNETAPTGYGAASGGQAIGFGFSNSNLAGVRDWYLPGADQHQTNTSLAFYNSNYVSWNPLSVQPNANGFLYGDVAVASLDKPAAGIPTWALLFSPLNNPGTIGANGTGYHVTIEGYGNNGTASTGSTGGIDYRRRIAENMVGGLASLGDFEQFLFGGGASNATNPQNLYWIDFDDPKRGTAGASPFDFNAWRDNAVTDGKEGITASGDSGGPLILDQTYAKQLVIGVLSGGYTRFFNGQPANGYGTASFYQPLYLYWDWIAANNPYHYVTSKAGNADWTDPTHWLTVQDPNYYVISGNTVVNGTPTTPGAGNTVQPGFGQACFQTATLSDCYDVATGTETANTNPIGTSGTVSNDKGTDSAGTFAGDASNDKAVVSGSSLAAQSSDNGSSVTSSGSQTPQAPNPLPAPTIDNGLPGATNFVPNNYDGNRFGLTAAQIKPAYYDVTLAATGTTTVTTNVVVDNLTINGVGAVLDIRPNGTLTSNLGVSQKVGTVNVDGRLISGGDYFLLLGGLSGSGSITAPYFTNTAGVIAPGTAGTVGTLTFNGNVVLSSASTLLIDIAGNHVSDQIYVGAPTVGSGIASLGGNVVVTPTAAVRAGDTYTFLYATGGIQAGTKFNTPSAISAILTPTFLYSSNAVTMRIDAGSYYDLLKGTGNSTLLAYGQLLDQNRRNQGNYPGIYGYLDLQSAGTISASLLGLAPQAQTLRNAIGTVAMDTNSSFYRERLETISGGKAGGTLAMLGKPVQLASFGLSGASLDARSDTSQGETVQEGALPDNMSAFIAGGYINGSSLPMGAMTYSSVRDQFDGYFIGGGLETTLGGGEAVLGFGFNYTSIDGTTAFAPQSAKGSLYAGTLYGRAHLGGGVMLDTQMSAGLLDITTRRNVAIGPSSYTLVAKDRPLAFSSEVALSKRFGGEIGTSLTPTIGMRAASLGFTQTAESGGGPALIYHGDNRVSIEGRAGAKAAYNSGILKAFVGGTYVHDFEDKAATFGANFVGGYGPYAQFAYSGVDKDWFEVSGGLKVSAHKFDLSVTGTTTIARRDIRDTTVRGAISVHF